MAELKKSSDAFWSIDLARVACMWLGRTRGIRETTDVDVLVIMAIGEARIVVDGDDGTGDRNKQTTTVILRTQHSTQNVHDSIVIAQSCEVKSTYRKQAILVYNLRFSRFTSPTLTLIYHTPSKISN